MPAEDAEREICEGATPAALACDSMDLLAMAEAERAEAVA